MTTKSPKQSLCAKHKRNNQILVVSLGKYICEQCAIFDHLYKNHILLEKQSIPDYLKKIDNLCNNLNNLQKSNKNAISKSIDSLLNSLDLIQSSLINDIKKQFQTIKSKIRARFLHNIHINEQERKKNGKLALNQLQKETLPQNKIKKQNSDKDNLLNYQQFLNRELTVINYTYDKINQKILKNKQLKFDIVSVFEHVMNTKIQQLMPRIQEPSCLIKQDDLLDFSEFSIINQKNQIYSQAKKENYKNQQQAFFKKANHESLKTASCLEDSICSFESMSRENIRPNLQLNQSVRLEESSLSDRSISCSSVISKALTCSTIITKQPSKKASIEVTSQSQLQSKLLSISPTIKCIRLINVSLSTQQFSSLLKEKISKSFIHSLEIIACPKLNEKILMDLKSFRCKSLKKVEIKECKEINWADKKVKDFVRKLQNDGLKIIF